MAEAHPQLRENVVAWVHHDDSDHVLFEAMVEFHPCAQEIVHGAGGFNAGETAASHHRRQGRLAPGFVRLIVRQFECVNDPVAHEDGVAQRFHRHGVLGEAGRVEEVCHRAKRQHELVVAHIDWVWQVGVRDAHLLLNQIDRLDVGNDHTRVTQHLSQRLHDVGDGHVAPGHLVEHGREQHEVLFSIKAISMSGSAASRFSRCSAA